MVRCDVVMANDVSGPIAFRAMERMGVERVFGFDPVDLVEGEVGAEDEVGAVGESGSGGRRWER